MNSLERIPDFEAIIDGRPIKMFRTDQPVPEYLVFEIGRTEPDPNPGQSGFTRGGIGVNEEAGIKAALGADWGKKFVCEMRKQNGMV